MVFPSERKTFCKVRNSSLGWTYPTDQTPPYSPPVRLPLDPPPPRGLKEHPTFFFSFQGS